MDDFDGLQALRDLHRDLLSFAASRISNVTRLEKELQERIIDFRNILNKSPKNDESRKQLQSENVLEVGEDEYGISAEFKNETIELADALDLDELEAARLLVKSQEEATLIDRRPWVCAVINFHQRRLTLLECLRTILKLSVNLEAEENVREYFRDLVNEILESKNGQLDNASRYWRRCVTGMGDIEYWLRALADRVQSIAIVGQSQVAEFTEVITVQERSLTRQHEALSAVAAYLSRGGHTGAEDFRFVLSKLQTFDRYDAPLIHYVPIITTCISSLAPVESTTSLEEARSLHASIVNFKDSAPWAMRSLYAATLFWWLVAYSGRYREDALGPHTSEIDLSKEAQERSSLVEEVLRDGCLHFTLSVLRDLRPIQWLDPAKQNFVSFLLHESTPLPFDTLLASDDFEDLVMQQFQELSESFVMNMPDDLRKLKDEEDDQRRQVFARFQRGPVEYELHLERFLLVIAYAFTGSPEASLSFWTDPTSHLQGFLGWAAKRQSTPRAAAFCEMLRSLSEGEESAEAADRFLLEEGATASSKIRRASSLSWNQIFAELHFYASNIRENPTPPKNALLQTGKSMEEQIVEPESGLMLQCYLRLAAHLFARSYSARNRTLQSEDTDVVDDLLVLCGGVLEGTLRASAFAVISSLLSDKNMQLSIGMWEKIDRWVSGVSPSSTAIVRVGTGGPNAVNSSQLIFQLIAAEFDDCLAFVELLENLVALPADTTALNDVLPFSEGLGSTYRMAGIEPYVDFVLGQIFGTKSLEIHDPTQLRMLQWHCLHFASLCLSSFNEDLVELANGSGLNVDELMGASSLAAYVKLHPFARTMEWFFNDRVIAALFMATHHDVEEVNNAAPNSPLLMALEQAIEVINLIMQLQATYLDIVRPIIKTQSKSRAPTVGNSALASFEDAILNNLQIVVDLGLYCGTGHENVTTLSLNLLQKLSSSRKLAVSSSAGFGPRSDRSRLISVLEKDGDSERISRSLSTNMEYDERELEAGLDAPGHVLKSIIISFLDGCLAALPNRPTLAHLLLGFACGSNTLDIPDNGLFMTRSSLFHAITYLADAYPDGNEVTYISWRNGIRYGCLELLRKLWTSPLSSVYTLTELRAADFLFLQASKQVSIGPGTLWDGRSVTDPEFLPDSSARAFRQFLQQRSTFMEYVAAELRSVVRNKTPSIGTRIKSSLLGTTITPDGQKLSNATIFDLFDFVEMEIADLPPLSAWTFQFLQDFDFEVCKTEREGNSQLYNLNSIAQLCQLKHSSLQKEGKLIASPEQERFAQESRTVLEYFRAFNQRSQIIAASSETLVAWVRLVAITLESCEFEASEKISYILQALQVIMPKLERSFVENHDIALQLAGLARSLLQHIDFNSLFSQKGKALDFAKDRLSQLFRIAMTGIYAQGSTSELREVCYQICYRYLVGAGKGAEGESDLSPQNLRMVIMAGENLVNVICEDAYAGQSACRISATMLLSALVVLTHRQDSKYLIESFSRFNFIGMLVDMIKHIPSDLRAGDMNRVTILVTYYNVALALLLRIAQTRAGAVRVVSAGIFQAIRDSGFFDADPDIGLEMNSPQALKIYFDLMLAIVKIINGLILTNGPQHGQTMYQARQFLKEYRTTVVAVFKKNAKIGGQFSEKEIDFDALVDNFTVMISATGFLEHEENASPKKPRVNGYFS
ncbi:MAG: hypothetical protein M1820_008395 [Bogoriella megaspora]|nr:MAG: hypothetical protein M1820_008395 [Bogoriella megaspora]